MVDKAPKIQQTSEVGERIQKDHNTGLFIAKAHLTPFVKDLSKKHGYTIPEIAHALVITAYNHLRIRYPAKISEHGLSIIARKSIKFIEDLRSSKLH